MKKEEINDWLQVAGLAGVIASLIFVGYEINQSREIAMADIYQQRSSMALDISLSKYSPEQVAKVMSTVRDDHLKITQQDALVLSDIMEARFIYYENVHFQYQLSMISDEEWAASRRLISRGFELAPCSPVWWRQTKETWRASFASEVDSLLEQLDMAPCTAPVWVQEKP